MLRSLDRGFVFPLPCRAQSSLSRSVRPNPVCQSQLDEPVLYHAAKVNCVGIRSTPHRISGCPKLTDAGGGPPDRFDIIQVYNQMRYAYDDRAKREVDAFDIRGGARYRSYSCPVCRARVHYRSSMARSPNPGFAHNKGAARPDCEHYHPGLVGYVPFPVVRPMPSAEDSPEEIGMCLEGEDSWRVYLRLPEISDLGDLRLSALQSGSVEVVSAGGRVAISLMELRPGSGSARVPVAPSETVYKVAPSGNWPVGLSAGRWRGSARGLNPDGTIFVQRRGEWVRLKEESSLELGGEIRVVALQSNRPPIPCTEFSRGPQQSGKWRAWRVQLPSEATEAIEEWAYELGIFLVEGSWTVSVASVPLGFSSGLPVYATQVPIVALLKSPERRAQTMVTSTCGSSTTSASIISSDRSAAYVSLDVAWAGTNELRAGVENRPGFSFLTERRPELAELRAALGIVPHLRVRVGESVCECWTGSYEMPVGEVTIQIEPELEDLRLGLHWKGDGEIGAEEGLTRESTIRRLAGFFGKSVDVRLSAGALGSVLLAYRSAKKAAISRSTTHLGRSLPEAGVVGAWMLRHGAGRLKGRNRWTALAISKLKESRNA